MAWTQLTRLLEICSVQRRSEPLNLISRFRHVAMNAVLTFTERERKRKKKETGGNSSICIYRILKETVLICENVNYVFS